MNRAGAVGRGGSGWAALDMRDYCFAMKSLTLGIVRASGGCAGACVRD
ncbi:MAG: hypothetical protein LBQ31_04020 [Bacteroidales bacterium]|nr:hypothetical protein [Bacteroidales bacterium]